MVDEREDTADELAQQAYSAVQRVTSALHDLVSVAGEILDPFVLADLLASCRDMKQDLARVYDEVESLFLPLAGEKKLEVPNLGVVEIKSSPKRTQWRHDELIPVIVARALDEREYDPETGEALEREAVTVARVLRECISFGAGKVTGLRARGIQPDEYCTEDEVHYSVKLPPRNEAA